MQGMRPLNLAQVSVSVSRVSQRLNATFPALYKGAEEVQDEFLNRDTDDNVHFAH